MSAAPGRINTAGSRAVVPPLAPAKSYPIPGVPVGRAPDLREDSVDTVFRKSRAVGQVGRALGREYVPRRVGRLRGSEVVEGVAYRVSHPRCRRRASDAGRVAGRFDPET